MIKVKAALLLFLLIITFIISIPPFAVAWILLQPTRILLETQMKWKEIIQKDLKFGE
jgi:hypothetical protein